MSTPQWTRVEGMIIGHRLDPAEVAQELAGRNVLAQLEWFTSSPHLIGVSVAVSEGTVALLPQGATTPTAGPTLSDLAEELAVLFEAEVRLGSAVSDYLTQDDASALATDDDDAMTGTSRVVEIGRTPASSVPLLAAMEGVDLADREMPEGRRALLAELPPTKVGWNFGELPLVTLSMTDGDFQAFLVQDDHIENVLTHNWGMETLLVPGGVDSADALPVDVSDLVGNRPDLAAIAGAVPGADVEAFLAAGYASGDNAVHAAVAALGLPDDVAAFLLGRIEIDEAEGFNTHLARGISTAIGRSVDIMLTDSDTAVHPVFDAYQALSIDRPWIVRSAAAVEAAVGAGLMVLALRSRKPSPWWVKAGGVLGGLMVVDSVAEVVLAKYVSSRRERREFLEGNGTL